MENNLTFLGTQTVEQFKAEHLVSRIDVKRNQKNGNLFFSFGAEVGAVSKKGVPKHPMISQVETPEGERFYLLHEEGNGGAPVIASF